jgi:glyoxylase-like metal-dependent hydrolase (beta-lactamase superfamily II)
MKYSPVRLSQGIALLFILTIAITQLQCSQAAPAEQARAVLERVADGMGGLEALQGINNITRSGTSQRSSLGQGPDAAKLMTTGRASPYKQIIDFTVPRELNLATAREVPTVADWEKGGYRDVFGMALRPLEPHQLTGYKAEWDRDICKFVVSALGDQSRLDNVSEGNLYGMPHDVVSLQYVDGLSYQVYVDRESHFISRIDFMRDLNPFGDVKTERTFSDYRDVGNVKLPFRESTADMGLVTQVREWSEISLNGELPEEQFKIAEGLEDLAKQIGHADTIEVIPSELAPGVWYGESMHMNNMWVEFEDFVVVIEGPTSEMHSLEVLRHVKETVGDKPIRYLITTHHHADHTGGIRTYVAEGATLVTHVNNEDALGERLTRPHTIKPDRLAQSGVEPQIETVADTHTITDGKRTIELMHVPNPHVNGYLAIYLPAERILFESDMYGVQSDRWQVVLDDTPPVRPEGVDFYEAVTKVGWRPRQIVTGHGILLSWSTLAEAVRVAKAAENN